MNMDNAFKNTYDRHVATVYRVCYALLGNAADAEDATHAVFVKLLESNPTFNDPSHEKAWLITTSRNYCLDLHRSWWRKRVVKFAPSFLKNMLITSDPQREMDEYLLKIPEKYRLVLYLYYYEGYKIAEIAQLLGLNENTVKTQMRDARKRLKMEVGDDFLE